MAIHKKVLMISYVFPPMAAVGGYRTIKFCKFLPAFGWQPSVLTVSHGYNTAYDQSLLDRIDPSVHIYRSGNLEPLTWWDLRSAPSSAVIETAPRPATDPGRTADRSLSVRLKSYVRKWISLPDRNNFWIPFGVFTGLRAIRREKIDIIYASAPPASAHVIGCKLSWLTGKPLVIDFRDLWTQNEGYHLRGLSPLMARLDRCMEKYVINRSRAVVTTTESFSDMIRKNNPSKNPQKVYTITNGVDRDDFAAVKFPERKNERFTILHLGSLYGQRNPAFFFEVLTKWLEQRPEVKDKIIADFIGNAPGFEKTVQQSALKNIVRFSRHVPHAQVLERLWQADLLLLILGFSSSASGVLPAKLFEYTCTGRPILALVPEGEAAKVLKNYEGGLAVTGADMERTLRILNKQYDNWEQSGKTRQSRLEIPPQFDRRRQAEKLAEVFDAI